VAWNSFSDSGYLWGGEKEGWRLDWSVSRGVRVDSGTWVKKDIPWRILGELRGSLLGVRSVRLVAQMRGG